MSRHLKILNIVLISLHNYGPLSMLPSTGSSSFATSALTGTSQTVTKKVIQMLVVIGLCLAMVLLYAYMGFCGASVFLMLIALLLLSIGPKTS